mmetsp:Transcript_13494/g.42380  ORF Transcript_13494/g.42380 Transcript_13494/m.42380 type:complete len:245 (-) Transcript_13494:344-1078(-)
MNQLVVLKHDDALGVLHHRAGIRAEVVLVAASSLVVPRQRERARVHAIQLRRGARGGRSGHAGRGGCGCYAIDAARRLRRRLATLDGQDERAAALAAHQLTGEVQRLEEQRVGALKGAHHLCHHFDEAQRGARGLGEVVVVLGQFGHHLGVGVGEELDALGLEQLLERLVVGDDTVVHHYEVLRVAVADVRVCVACRRRAVRRPARVRDAHLPCQGGLLVQRARVRLGRHVRAQRGDLALRAED